MIVFITYIVPNSTSVSVLTEVSLLEVGEVDSNYTQTNEKVDRQEDEPHYTGRSHIDFYLCLGPGREIDGRIEEQGYIGQEDGETLKSDQKLHRVHVRIDLGELTKVVGSEDQDDENGVSDEHPDQGCKVFPNRVPDAGCYGRDGGQDVRQEVHFTLRNFGLLSVRQKLSRLFPVLDERTEVEHEWRMRRSLKPGMRVRVLLPSPNVFMSPALAGMIRHSLSFGFSRE